MSEVLQSSMSISSSPSAPDEFTATQLRTTSTQTPSKMVHSSCTMKRKYRLRQGVARAER